MAYYSLCFDCRNCLFICPVGLMIISIVKCSIDYFLTSLIWLITSVALVVFEEDEVRRIIKEEFKK